MDREYLVEKLLDDESFMDKTEQNIYDFLNELELNFEWEEIETLIGKSIDERFRKLSTKKITTGMNFYDVLCRELRSLSWPVSFGTIGVLVRCMHESSLTKEHYLPYLIASLEQILYRQLFTYVMRRYTVWNTIEDCYLSDLAVAIKGDPENIVNRAVKRLGAIYDHLCFLLFKLRGRKAVYVPYIRPAIGLILLIWILCLYYFDYLEALGDDDDGGDKKHHHHRHHHHHHHKPYRLPPLPKPKPKKPEVKHHERKRYIVRSGSSEKCDRSKAN